MGRRRKGRDVHGWVIVDKPAGITSSGMVNKVRWAFDAKKAGHAGTLDPDATGLLAIALGEATKTIPCVTDALKCYRFAVAWGAETHSDDASGEVLRTAPDRPDAARVEEALAHFRGQISQVPPQVSAVKVQGARAYDLVRDGEVVDLAARPLWVDRLDLTEASENGAVLEMTCGKGGYVRSIARDLGRALGCLGHVSWLRRLWSGPFDLDVAVTLETIEAGARTEALDAHLQPLELGLAAIPALPVTENAAARLRNGNPCDVTMGLEYGETAWASRDGFAVAIGTYRAGMFHPSRVLQT